MKNKIKTEYIFLFSIAFLLISFILIFTLFIFREKHTNELSNEFIADRTINFLIDAYNNNELKRAFESSNNILGFGIYNPEGSPTVRIGGAPIRVKPDAIFNRQKFRYNRDKGSIIYLKPLMPMPMPHMMFRKKMHEMMMGMRGDIAYLELKSPAFFKKRMLFNTFSLFIPLLFILLTVLFIILYNKNLNYRKVLNRQKEMVKLGEISRTLAHEIKNPLSAMRIQTGYLQKVLPVKYKDDLKPINEEIERLRLLTDRIGDLLRNPLGNPIKIDIIRYIEELIKKYDIKINFEITGDDKIFINFDTERLRSIFENIIINSIESIEDKKKGQIDIRLFKEKDYVNIIVLDNGLGLPSDYEDKIFDPYYTTKTKGTGLGLSITKRFLDASASEITIDSGTKNGTEVKIRIPLLKE